MDGADGSTFYSYIGAGATKASNNYAVAYIQRGGKQFMPLAPSNSTLTGAKINFLTLYGMLPIAVKDGTQRVYQYSKIDHVVPAANGSAAATWTDKPKVSIIESDIVHDATGTDTAEIVGLSASINISHTSTTGSRVSPFVFIPVKASGGGTFGAAGSGIAVGEITARAQKVTDEEGKVIKDKTGNEVEKMVSRFELINADPSNTTVADNLAAPFNGTLAALGIDDDVTLVGDIVDIHVDQDLSRIYCAVQATSGAAGGTRSIVVGRIVGKKLEFSPIAPDAAIVGNDKIIGTASNAATVTAFKVRTMQTSTRLEYLIVSGGNGALSAVGDKVYAMPLVNLRARAQKSSEWMDSSTHGTLAKYDQAPQTKIYKGIKNFVKGKVMETPATAADDLLSTADTAAVVGAGDLPMDPTTQNITDMFIQNDSVFVAIGGDYDGGITMPGLFESEAIFDQLGRVAAWTPWKRVGGTDDKIFHASLDTAGQSASGSAGANFWLMPGSDSSSVRAARRSVWGVGNEDGLLGGTNNDVSVGLVNYMSNNFPQEQGGVQALAEYIDMNSNPLLLGLNQLGILVVGGHQKVTLAQTGRGDGSSNFIPTKGDFTMAMAGSLDGSLPTATADTRILTVAGGDLNDIGPITSSAIVTNVIGGITRHYWLVVAGAGGVAVLSDASGNGWTTPLTGLNSFPSDMTFKKIGSYSQVSKLIGANNDMYVLTTKSLERLVLTPPTIISNTVSRTIVGTPDSVTGSKITRFTDAVVSSGGVSLGLLATTRGLYRIANGSNINSASSNLGWVHVPLPGGVGPVFQFAPLSNTELATGFASTGQLYVLGVYHGYYSSRVHRFYVNLDGTVDNNTVRLVNDQIILDSTIYFIDFGDFRTSFLPDGGLFFHSRSKDIRFQDPTLTEDDSTIPLSLFSMPSNNLLFAGVLPASKSTNIGLSPERGTTVDRLIRSSALGGWLVPGDYGVRVSE